MKRKKVVKTKSLIESKMLDFGGIRTWDLMGKTYKDWNLSSNQYDINFMK